MRFGVQYLIYCAVQNNRKHLAKFRFSGSSVVVAQSSDITGFNDAILIQTFHKF